MTNQNQTLIITAGSQMGMSHTRPVVARVIVGDDDDLDDAPILIEFSLGLSWTGPRPPVWEELARRADLASRESLCQVAGRRLRRGEPTRGSAGHVADEIHAFESAVDLVVPRCEATAAQCQRHVGGGGG